MWTSSKLFKIVIGIVVVFTFVISVICFIDKGWSVVHFKSAFSKKKVAVIGVPCDNTINIIDDIVNDINEFDKEFELNRIIKCCQDLQPRLDTDLARLIAKSIIKHGKEFGFPPELLCSLIFRESAFNTVAVSSASCLGLMQINPKAHGDKIKRLGLEYNDLCKIDNNIRLGCMILREYYDKSHSIRKALHRYVGGKETQYVLDILGEFANSQIKTSVK